MVNDPITTEVSADNQPTMEKPNKSKPRIDRPYPKVPLEEAIRIPCLIKDKNGGNPWSTELLAKASLDVAKSNTRFFYLAKASRDFGFTEGGRDSEVVSLTEFGRELAYAPNVDTEDQIKKQAFLSVDIFKKVLEYYQGSELPEMKYLSNTLEKEFGLHPETHSEFSELFKKNCDYLGIGKGIAKEENSKDVDMVALPAKIDIGHTGNTITLAEPEKTTGLTCFVAIPFTERSSEHPAGFFTEVLKHLIVPAGRQAGFKVITAKRTGTDVIQSTIVNDLLNADLVVADLTEHNPNVLFELGMRMAFDRPVALIRAEGTGSIFDVDNMLRVLDYNPNLWPSTVERDLPRLAEHIKATWGNKEGLNSFMKILSQAPAKK